MPKRLSVPTPQRKFARKDSTQKIGNQASNQTSVDEMVKAEPSVASSDPNTILQMQSMFGNRATIKLLQRDEKGGGGQNENDTNDTEQKAPEKPDPLAINLSQQDYNDCLQIYKDTPSWESLKSLYVSSETPDYMQMAKLWKFRRDYVVNVIKTLRATKYPDLLAKSVGSNDLTSDYDVTLASPGSGNDVKAIQAFNEHVKAEFGVQSGTLFDTNLYARDFAPVDQSSEFKDANVDYAKDSGIGSLVTMSEMEGDVEDVGALIKVRRYMSQVEWDAHTEEIVNGVDEDRQDKVRRRYDEADAIYQIATANLLQRVKESLNEVGDDLDEQVDTYEPDTLDKNDEQENPLITAQKENASDLHHLEEKESDLVLEKSNDIYLERMTVIREMQGKIAKLQEELDTLGSKDISIQTLKNLFKDDQMANMFNGMINNAKARDLPKIIDAKKTQIKQLMSEAIFYAAEAYTSEGAIMHIVAGIQGSKLTDDEKSGLNDEQQKELLAEKMQKANDKLTLDHLLQSVNEQFGDFLKDYGHLSKKTDGTMYIKSSKYVDRMLDAIDILVKRNPEVFEEAANDAVSAAFDVKNLADLRGEIKKLYAARKDPAMWGKDRDLNAMAIMMAMGINNRSKYKSAIITLGSQINIILRNQIDMADDEQEKRYFKNLDTEGMKDLEQ